MERRVMLCYDRDKSTMGSHSEIENLQIDENSRDSRELNVKAACREIFEKVLVKVDVCLDTTWVVFGQDQPIEDC